MRPPLKLISALIAAAGVSVALTTTAASAGAGSLPHPLRLTQPETAPTEFLALIEIPQGSFTKYEIDPVSGHVMVDRFQSMAVQYPANYGAVPSTLGDDGDSLDVLVITRAPIVPGALILVRPIGVLNMIDGGQGDEKIIAVPTSAVDPAYDGWQDITDIPLVERQAIEEFFRVYKNLPKGRKVVEVSGFGDRQAALALMRRSLKTTQQFKAPAGQHLRKKVQ